MLRTRLGTGLGTGLGTRLGTRLGTGLGTGLGTRFRNSNCKKQKEKQLCTLEEYSERGKDEY